MKLLCSSAGARTQGTTLYNCAVTLDSEPSGELMERIANALPTLRPAERRVAQAVLAEPSLVARESISALAERCQTSAPTIVRFAKRLGFSGYPALRVGLAMAIGVEEGRTGRASLLEQLDPGDGVADAVAKVARANARSVEDTAAHIDLHALQHAAETLGDARHIDALGVGSSSLSAMDLVQKLARFGMPAWTHTDRHDAMTACALRSEGDTVVGFSHSGATVDLIEPMRLAAARGVTTIGVTSQASSPLAQMADIVILYRSTDPTYRLGAMGSRIAQLTVVDFLLVRLALAHPKTVQQALETTFAALSDL